jgi:BirA family transcriptional regulator, biotin operon repressor / biotin---[acetyl-CoA-carboxylase] ligase
VKLDIERIRALRASNRIHFFETIGSTMTEAASLAEAGAVHATVILAEEQTAGVGRLGRSWLSPAGAGIYCSIVLRLNLAPSSVPIASLLVGLAAADAIQKTTNLLCDLRWPNDVLIGERKVAGILTHLIGDCVIAGIGINVNQLGFPTDLRTPATSLRIESNGRLQSREQVIVQLLESVDAFCRTLDNEGVAEILRAFSASSSYARNRRVIVEDSGARGTTNGLDENGFLLIRFDDGQMQRLAAGGVRPAN